MSDLYARFIAIVRQIPEGRVATYGQIASMAGHPRHARHVGYALSALDTDSDVPWHRVLNSSGKISRRGLSGCDDFQRLLLEEEGVEFGPGGRINLQRFQWLSHAQYD